MELHAFYTTIKLFFEHHAHKLIANYHIQFSDLQMLRLKSQASIYLAFHIKIVYRNDLKSPYSIYFI